MRIAASVLFSATLALVAAPAGAESPARGEAIGTVRATAHVVVSDGLEYDVVTLFHDHQRAAFRTIYPDGSSTLGIDGKYVWIYDGERESEGPPVLSGMVLGHQVHAQLLFFETLNGPLETARLDCGGQVCVELLGAAGHRLVRELGSGRAVRLSWARENEAPVELTFDDWRVVEGIELPFAVTFDDAERVFEYAYASVTFNEGSLDELRAPLGVLTDEQRLLRRHRVAMDAHFFEDPTMMQGYFTEQGVVVSRGEIVDATSQESEAMMQEIFSTRNHRRYDDVVRPIVRVSADGTLGWVIAQVEVTGVLLDESGEPAGPMEFTAAWVSLFEKVDGAWKLSGNVSNFKPRES